MNMVEIMFYMAAGLGGRARESNNMNMAKIMFYMADLNQKDRLIDLDDGAFSSENFQNFTFGMASEFFFHCYGDHRRAKRGRSRGFSDPGISVPSLYSRRR